MNKLKKHSVIWPFTVWINCSSDLKVFWSLEQFFLTVGQNNFVNKVPFPIWIFFPFFQVQLQRNNEIPNQSNLLGLRKYRKSLKKYLCLNSLYKVERNQDTSTIRNHINVSQAECHEVKNDWKNIVSWSQYAIQGDIDFYIHLR